MFNLKSTTQLAVDTALLDGIPTYLLSSTNAAMHAFKVAFMVYALRGEMRDHGHQYWGGLFGGAIKYALKDSGGMPWYYAPIKGAINNVLYELNRDYIPAEYGNFMPTIIETLEGLVHGYITGGLTGAVQEGVDAAKITTIITAATWALSDTISNDIFNTLNTQINPLMDDLTLEVSTHYNQTPLIMAENFIA